MGVDETSRPNAIEGSAPHAPLSGSERISSLDTLRAFAVLGMILVHLHDRAVFAFGSADLVSRLIELFVVTKARTVFGILFGVSFAIQLSRADRRGEPFVWPFLRRLVGLALFGLVDSAFGYNVLISYALPAPLLLAVQRWPTRALVVALIACAVWGGVYRDLKALAAGGHPPTIVATRAPRDASQSADVRRVASDRVHRMLVAVAHPERLLLLPTGLTLFLLGVIGLRIGVWERPWDHRPLIMGLMVYGVVSWAVFHFLAGPERAAWGLIASRWLALTYIGAFILLRPVRAHAGLIDAAGRMPLTIYMVQLVALGIAFSRHGLGLTIKPVIVPVVTLALFGVMAMFSRWWLTRFRIGPAEWILRSLTYARLQPIRRPDSVAAPAPAAS